MESKVIKRLNSDNERWEYTPKSIYKNGALYQIGQAEGRVIKLSNQFVFEFEYRDIWRNLRASFRDSLATPSGGIYAPPVISQTADYDLYGFELANSQKGSNTFLYQNQERVADYGLSWDFFSRRPSDNQLGRFTSIDPIASDFPYNSPYALQENKFGLGIELEGRELENFISQFKDPQDLKVKLPDPAKSQNQSYSVSVSNPKVSFSEIKDTFLKTPEKILTNSKAEFHAPENAKGEQTGLQKGNTIEIEIDGPQNDSYVKVQNVSNGKDRVSATFVTLEGHIEKGIINFSVQDNGKNGMSFTISSTSQVDYGLAPEGFARSQQKESWKEVLSNFTKTTGGKETTRIIK